MNRFFTQRRDRLLTYQAMREGRITSTRRKACPSCGVESSALDWSRSQQVCPRCGYHAPVGAYYRLSMILDPGSFQELDEKLEPANPLDFPGYPEKLEQMQEDTGLRDAAVSCVGEIQRHKAVLAVLDSRFIMASMGTAVGEKVTRAAEYAMRHKLPLIIFAASGGARMQEGIFSLMQMAKTAAAIERFQSKGGLYISCLTHPTTGGVTASFASLGDIMLSEPGALIGFAGPGSLSRPSERSSLRASNGQSICWTTVFWTRLSPEMSGAAYWASCWPSTRRGDEHEHLYT